MKARTGDWLVVREPTVDGHRRIGKILSVGHPDGSPPYRVRWTDTDHESLVFPGPDAIVEPREAHEEVPG